MNEEPNKKMEINGKHIIAELNGIRCSILETEADQTRADFLKELLEYNGYEVQIQENQPPPPKKASGENEEQENMSTEVEKAPPVVYNIGVTDLTFILPVVLFGQQLSIPGSKKQVSPEYWYGRTDSRSGWYWDSVNEAKLT